MSTWEVLRLCGLYIWYNNAPAWVDWFCDMAPAFAILGGIALGIVSEVIATEMRQAIRRLREPLED